MMRDLFCKSEPVTKSAQVYDGAFGQYMTPEWAADAIVNELWPSLDEQDVVLEPSCGTGAWLKAIPSHVMAYGVELDPALAEDARRNTGREILVGDFRTIKLPAELERPSLIVGNPPYRMKTLDAFLERAHGLLPKNGQCGFLLGTQLLQTPSTVLRWNSKWSLDQRLVPRTLFPRSIRPLVFVLFTKDMERRWLGGFLLYRESADVSEMTRDARLLLMRGRPGKTCWRSVVEWALERAGGKANVQELYRIISPNRPTENQFWKEKVRQTLQRHFVPVERGVWAVAA